MNVRFKIQLQKKTRIENAYNSKPNYVDLVNLVRSIQRAEGNIDCYRRGGQECDQMNCAWRDHCLKASERPSKMADEVRTSSCPKF